MDIIRLTGENCKRTRPLWEEVFSEDSQQFVDYYYEEKAGYNIGYAAGEEPYEAMLFLTPYPVQIYDKIKQLSYIVGVATRKEYRHKGRMTALMMHAMKEMYRQKQPFTFLMPADPAIYEPFGFSYVYDRPQWSFWDERFPLEVLEPLMGTTQTLILGHKPDLIAAERPSKRFVQAAERPSNRFVQAAEGPSKRFVQAAEGPSKRFVQAAEQPNNRFVQAAEQPSNRFVQAASQPKKEYVRMTGVATEKELRLSSLWGQTQGLEEQKRKDREPSKEDQWFKKLAEFANSWLAQRCQIYVKRDVLYYRRQLAQQRAQNGDIFLLWQEDRLVGFFLYAREGDEIAVQEMMEEIPGSFSFLQEAKERKPMIMARIIHLEEMMKLARSAQNRAVLIDVKDPLIPENEGLYLWEMTPYKSRVTRQKEGRAELSVTIEELSCQLIQGVFLNEIV